MFFNPHRELEGRHAFLSASKYHWIRYDDEKQESVFRKHMDAMKGTQLHNFAAEAIRLGIKLRSTKQTLNMYVNDAISYRMTPEQPLYYSDNAFGTADAISFRKGLLRIHDLKNGVSPASMDQLQIYAAFFCLEYRVKPHDISMELRIYQNDEVETYIPDPEDILFIMDRIETVDKMINIWKAEALR